MNKPTPETPVIDQDLQAICRARQLALSHIRREVELGHTENHIAATEHYSSGPATYFNGRASKWGKHSVQIVPAGRMSRGKRIASHKIIVYEVDGVRVNLTFSLHELYEELKQGNEQPMLWE